MERINLFPKVKVLERPVLDDVLQVKFHDVKIDVLHISEISVNKTIFVFQQVLQEVIDADDSESRTIVLRSTPVL